MRVKLKSINANKEVVFLRLTDLLGKVPVLDHDTFVFTVETPFEWDKVKTLVDDFATEHEILLILPQ